MFMAHHIVSAASFPGWGLLRAMWLCREEPGPSMVFVGERHREKQVENKEQEFEELK